MYLIRICKSAEKKYRYFLQETKQKPLAAHSVLSRIKNIIFGEVGSDAFHCLHHHIFDTELGFSETWVLKKKVKPRSKKSKQSKRNTYERQKGSQGWTGFVRNKHVPVNFKRTWTQKFTSNIMACKTWGLIASFCFKHRHVWYRAGRLYVYQVSSYLAT